MFFGQDVIEVGLASEKLAHGPGVLPPARHLEELIA